ncbi:MAG: ATP-binding protein [Chloroflexota bacterium]
MLTSKKRRVSSSKTYISLRSNLRYVIENRVYCRVCQNTCARKNLGYNLETLRQMTPLDIKPAYTPATFADLVAPLRDGKQEKIIFETYHLRQDITTYPVEVHLQLMTQDNQRVFVAIILDITERKQLNAYNNDLGRIFEKSLNEIFIFDAETLCFIEVNRGARENLGYSMVELRQMTPLDIKPEYTEQLFSELIAPLRRREREIIVFETVHLRKDKTTYSVEVHLQLTELGGEAVFVAIILDIAHRKETEQHLLNLHLAEQRTQLIRDFISDTSHEFRTSLAVIKTKSYLLKKYLTEQTVTKHIDIVERHVQRLNRLVGALQEAAILESTKQDDLTIQEIAINGLVSSVVQKHEHRMAEKNLALMLNLQPLPSAIAGDRERLYAVLENVLDNAIQFTKVGGHIRINTDVQDTMVCITISDDGIGIPTDALPHVCNYLYRVDEARSMNGGVGMGLAIVKRIVDLHAGKMDILSQEQEGTTITIHLPLSSETHLLSEH